MRFVPILALGVLTAFQAAWAQREPVRYDVYLVGVRAAELMVTAGSRSPVYSIRKKDLAANFWQPVHSSPIAAVASDTAFRLWGSTRDFSSQLARLESIDWQAHDVIAWPDRSSLYERTRELTAIVAGRPMKATRWNKRDAYLPMDLVIGPKNQFIAGIDSRADIVVVRRGFEGFTNVAAWNDPKVSQAKYGWRSLGKQMMPAADGIGLATFVYLPSGDAKGPFPTVLIRTPYGVSRLIDDYWHYAARGFAVVLQAVRGTSYADPTGRSEGEFEMMVNEPADGKAALEWVVKQPWSNGKICMQGPSYLGYTQWAAAMAGNPALKCLVPEVSMGTAFTDQPYVGGSLLAGWAYYLFWLQDKKLLPGRTWTDVLAHRPLVTLDEFATGTNIPNWDRQVLAATNGAYWKGQDWHHAPIRPDLATYNLSGWFDDDLPGTLSNWSLMAKIGTAPQRLMLGPWKHGADLDRALNGYSYGLNSLRDDLWLIKQQWYDHFLKGVDNDVTKTRVEYFVLGANEWRTATAWPPNEVVPETWYFHSDGAANRRFTSGSLTRAAPMTDEPADQYRYDPSHPVPNWMSFDRLEHWEDLQTWQWDMKDLEARHDVVTFTSAPLEQDLTIAGDILAVVHASTDAKDTDWWVHVSDVDPAGRSNRLTLGSIRARFRNLEDPRFHGAGSNFEREELLSGNLTEVIRYQIGIKGVANTFKKGHRIRVAIMNSLDYYTFPNSNTGGDEARATETVVGTMRLHHTSQYPSHLVLPVLPPGR